MDYAFWIVATNVILSFVFVIKAYPIECMPNMKGKIEYWNSYSAKYYGA